METLSAQSSQEILDVRTRQAFHRIKAQADVFCQSWSINQRACLFNFILGYLLWSSLNFFEVKSEAGHIIGLGQLPSHDGLEFLKLFEVSCDKGNLEFLRCDFTNGGL